MTILLFAIGAAIIASAVAGLVELLRQRLNALLVEVTGSSARAAYWTVTSLVTIALLALLAGTMTSTYPGDGASATDMFFGLMGQVRLGLLGLLASLLLVAVVLMRMISRFERFTFWSQQQAAAASRPQSAATSPAEPATGPRCPTCQAPLKPGDIWCNRCGSPVPDKPGQ